MIKCTLCYIFNNDGEVLLQYKAKGFGIGKWNGPGGKIEIRETSEEGAIREVQEETGLKVKNLKHVGKFDFIFKGKSEWDNKVFVYTTDDWSGEITESEEGKLSWFSPDKLPFDEMWEDDRIWLRDALNGNYQRYRFYFDNKGKLIYFKNLFKNNN